MNLSKNVLFDEDEYDIKQYNGVYIVNGHTRYGTTQKQITRNIMKLKKDHIKKIKENFLRRLGWKFDSAKADYMCSREVKQLLLDTNKRSRKECLELAKTLKVDIVKLFENEIIRYEPYSHDCIICGSNLQHAKTICQCGQRYIVGKSDTGLININLIPLLYDNHEIVQLLDRYWDGSTNPESLNYLKRNLSESNFELATLTIKAMTTDDILKQGMNQCHRYDDIKDDRIKLVQFISDAQITQQIYGRVGGSRYNTTIRETFGDDYYHLITDLYHFKYDMIEMSGKYLEKYCNHQPYFNGIERHDRELIYDICVDFIKDTIQPALDNGLDIPELMHVEYYQTIKDMIRCFGFGPAI